MKNIYKSTKGRHLILATIKRKNLNFQVFLRPRKNRPPAAYIRIKKRNQYFWLSPQRGFFNPKFACELALYKYLTYEILKSVNLPIPKFKKITGLEQINKINIAAPWVIKPVALTEGRGVIIGIKNKKELQYYCRQLFKKYSSLIIEKFIPGQDFRLLILENKLLGGVKRIPPTIKGDGRHTIKELIEISNRHRTTTPQKFAPFLMPLRVDLEMERCLLRQGFNLNTKVKKNQMILLRENANVSTGGEVEEVTEKIHPENVKIAIKAVRALSLKIGGVDIKTPNIKKPVTETGGKIIEVNSIPSLWIHQFPNYGQGRDVAGEVINYLFSTKD